MIGLLLVLLIVFVAVFAAVALVILAFSKPKSRSDVERRLERAGAGRRLRRREPRPKTAPLRVLEERLKPFAVGRLTQEREAALLKQLRSAGDYDTTPAGFVARQLAAAAVLPVAFLVVNWGIFDLPTLALPIGLLLAVYGGYRLPASRLAQQVQRRQEAILRQLPTTLDLLTTCVEAGMTLQSGMQKVVERMRPHPLREELE
ncbi:MAG: hypothetical protein KGR26_15115, partial [Cyanobacteria bacterium REEB65]|nr:hypothetical protein [Cyanobacteria bacterium REEB65]